MEPYLKLDRGTLANKILALKWEVNIRPSALPLEIDGAIPGCYQPNWTFSHFTMLSVCVCVKAF